VCYRFDRLLAADCKKSLSSDNLAAAAADTDTRRLPPSPFRDMENDEYAQFVAGVEEMRVSPVISRRGFLYFLEENATGWVKMWVVSILPCSSSYPSFVLTRRHCLLVLLMWSLVKRGIAECEMRKVKCGIENCGNGCGMVGKMRNAESVKRRVNIAY